MESTRGAEVLRSCMACALAHGAGFVFGLSPTGVINLAGAALILVLVSLTATVVPARRAASVDPMVALRCE